MNMKRNDAFIIILIQFLHVTSNCVLLLVYFLLGKSLKLKNIKYDKDFVPPYKQLAVLLYLSYKIHSYFCSYGCSYTKILRFFMHSFICCVHRNVGFQSIFSDSFKRKAQNKEFCPYKYYICNIAEVLSNALEVR